MGATLPFQGPLTGSPRFPASPSRPRNDCPPSRRFRIANRTQCDAGGRAVHAGLAMPAGPARRGTQPAESRRRKVECLVCGSKVECLDSPRDSPRTFIAAYDGRAWKPVLRQRRAQQSECLDSFFEPSNQSVWIPVPSAHRTDFPRLQRATGHVTTSTEASAMDSAGRRDRHASLRDAVAPIAR